MGRFRLMKLLMDTHIWLWGLLEPARLSKRVAKALANPSNEIWFSPISTWEILVLCQKGRLVLQPDAAAWISAALAQVPLKEAPLTHEVAIATEQVMLPHADPADRFLAASAKTYGLTLVTADRNLIGGSGYPVLANQ
jgi:PIN domain nuclease of toxin-antitoxin system